jgi:hypothetical protein
VSGIFDARCLECCRSGKLTSSKAWRTAYSTVEIEEYALASEFQVAGTVQTGPRDLIQKRQRSGTRFKRRSGNLMQVSALLVRPCQAAREEDSAVLVRGVFQRRKRRHLILDQLAGKIAGTCVDDTTESLWNLDKIGMRR